MCPKQFIDLIDPQSSAVDTEMARALLKEFAAAHIYRSATVEELVLKDEYFRRPLRPEDLAFIDFSTLIDRDSSSSLSALATHRMLLCINDAKRIRLPRNREREWDSFLEFYSDRNRVLGEMMRPHLEYHAFHSFEESTREVAGSLASLVALALETSELRNEAEVRQARLVASQPGGTEKQRMQLVQFFGLAEERYVALQNIANAWLSDVPEAATAAQTWLGNIGVSKERVSAYLGYPIGSHSCWQFYLAGTMATANLLHYLCSSGRNVFQSLGALLFSRIAQDAFLRQNSRWMAEEAGDPMNPEALKAWIQSLVTPVANRWGPSVWVDVCSGFRLSALMQDIADQDLRRQLSWISGLDRYRRLAGDIQDKIDREQIQIDRETFVEPREMCSTTHVHDDHRLVVIESGEMVFWAAPGMRICLSPGEKILVPCQRLHGSSVLSEVCVYHQPIIPEDWINPHIADTLVSALAH